MTNQSYPNERDCEHGSMRGKCNICDLQEDIAKLEAENDKLRKELELKVTIHKNQAKRDLLQQAKGIEDYISDAMEFYFILHLNENVVYHNFLIGLNSRAIQLRKQAEGE